MTERSSERVGRTAAQAPVPGLAPRRTRDATSSSAGSPMPNIDKFDEAELDDFERLIEAPNAELYALGHRRRQRSGELRHCRARQN